MGTSLKDNKYLWFLISTAILASLVYFSDVNRFFNSIKNANPLYLASALVFGLAVFPLWSYVWYRVFKKSGIDIPYPKAIKIFMAGNFMNSITPLGQAGGEPIMAYLVEKNTDTNYQKAVSSIISADIMNATPPITFVLGGSLFLLLFGSVNQIVLQALYMALLATAVGGTIVYFLWFESGTIEGKIIALVEAITQKIGKGQKYADKLEEKLEEVEESFKQIGKEPIYLLKTSLISHTAFLMQIFNFFLIMQSIGQHPNFTPIYFVVVLSGLANFSPTPGGSGTYEAAMAGLITIFFPGINFATGLTVAILFRLSTYWPGILLGWLALNSLNGNPET